MVSVCGKNPHFHKRVSKQDDTIIKTKNPTHLLSSKPNATITVIKIVNNFNTLYVDDY